MTVEILVLCGFAFLAGFVDSVVGGGGLIQLPALLIVLPAATPYATVLGTNKLAAFCGTAAAAWNYSRHVRIPWRAVGAATASALVFSVAGAQVANLLDRALVRPLVVVLLSAVAIYTFVQKDFGSLHAPRLDPGQQRWVGAVVGGLIGFYDGFFGPGTGSFLIFAFVGLFGFDFLAASAAAKLVNSAANFSALGNFAVTGHVLYATALPMAACNILGSLTGARLAILRGSRFVRWFFLVVVAAIIGKLGYDTWRGL